MRPLFAEIISSSDSMNLKKKMRSFKIFLTKEPYGNDPSQWAIPGLSFLNFCFFNTVDSKQMVYNFLPTTGFEPWTSCVEATTLSTKSQPLTNCCLCYLLFSSSTKPYLIFTFCDLTFFSIQTLIVLV